MDFKHLSEYIIPILILLFYIFSGRKKKKPGNPPQRRETFRNDLEEDVRHSPPPREIEPPLPKKAARSLPPVQRTLSDFESMITTRHIPTHIEKRKLVSAISDERTQSLVSTELTEHIDLDLAYAAKPRHRISRGRALFSKPSGLQNAFILQEIFKRPYDN